MKPEELLTPLKDKIWDEVAPRISNRRLLLTYRGVIPIDMIEYTINNINKRPSEVHMGIDILDGNQVTQVAVDFGRLLTIKQSNCKALFNIEISGRVVAPRIRTISTRKHWEDVMTYINSCCSRDEPAAEPWYYYIVEVMNEDSDLDRIHWFCNEDGNDYNMKAINYVKSLGSEDWGIIEDIRNSTHLKTELANRIVENCNVYGMIIQLRNTSSKIHSILNSLKTGSSIRINHRLSLEAKMGNIIVIADRLPEPDDIYNVIVIRDGEYV